MSRHFLGHIVGDGVVACGCNVCEREGVEARGVGAGRLLSCGLPGVAEGRRLRLVHSCQTLLGHGFLGRSGSAGAASAGGRWGGLVVEQERADGGGGGVHSGGRSCSGGGFRPPPVCMGRYALDGTRRQCVGISESYGGCGA
jgi:hypothetical protein